MNEENKTENIKAESIAPEPEIEPSAEAVKKWVDWLKEWFARKLETTAATIQAEVPFTDFGVDSVMAVQLLTEMEKVLQTRLKTTMLLEHTNINSLARYLAVLEEVKKSESK